MAVVTSATYRLHPVPPTGVAGLALTVALQGDGATKALLSPFMEVGKTSDFNKVCAPYFVAHTCAFICRRVVYGPISIPRPWWCWSWGVLLRCRHILLGENE